VFAADPWHADGTLAFGPIRPWTLWLARPAVAAG
jgi:hypothetical protein